MTKAQKRSLRTVIRYLGHDEYISYLEWGKPKKHMFNHLKILKGVR